MNSQNVFHVVEVEIDCPREIPVVSAAYVMEVSTKARRGSLGTACASPQSEDAIKRSMPSFTRVNMGRARRSANLPRHLKHHTMLFVCAMSLIN